ncbi:hypothetical protein L0F63_003366 [Massospora cicadina]|nr:hypothetical protein L0F63_003366 [Massospora cicadina]
MELPVIPDMSPPPIIPDLSLQRRDQSGGMAAATATITSTHSAHTTTHELCQVNTVVSQVVVAAATAAHAQCPHGHAHQILTSSQFFGFAYRCAQRNLCQSKNSVGVNFIIL